MTREQSDAIPYREHPRDSDFTIGEQRYTNGTTGYGIIWYHPPVESWGFQSFGEALCNARRIADSVIEQLDRTADTSVTPE